jgi:TPR repeat protein
VLLIFSALFPASTFALDAIDHSSSVFKFQQKLADSGNVQAQYKLGYLYEAGEGIEADLDKALHWYERAASTGLRAAEQRRDYLMVRELGYNKQQNKAWLDSVKQDAADHKEPAMQN